MRVSINQGVQELISEQEILNYQALVQGHIKKLENKTGLGNDFLAWLDLPSNTSFELLQDIYNTSKLIRANSEIVVVIGIGGSYLGAKSVIEALSNSFQISKNNEGNPLVLFAGQNLSEDYLFELLEILENKSFSIIVISKSGTTIEPAIAFRILKNKLESTLGEREAQKRIFAITDAENGALKTLATQENYKTFVIPNDIGGRYSVFTPVGLLPIAVAGFDIFELIKGAKIMENQTSSEVDFSQNPAAIYATIRNLFYQKGKKIEILANYNPKLSYLAEWWKQLFGESEGKENKGIFPASVNFTRDLHSLGQYIQEGERTIFETIISVKNPKYLLNIPEDKNNLDNLNYLAGKRISDINKKVEQATTMAHESGGVPNLRIELPKLDEFYLGNLLYFFQKSCAISAYILNVNPFNQEGVEAYKKNMFTLLKEENVTKPVNE